MKLLDSLVVDYTPDSMTVNEIRIHIAKQAELFPRERRKAMSIMRSLNEGLRLLNKIKASKNGQMSKAIPKEKQWRNLVLKDPRGKAEWYLKYCPDKGTLDYNLFKRLSKAFGLGGNEFYYWIRKLR